MRKLRLQKAIALSGISSRRRAECLIKEGRVRVNGEIITRMGTCVDLNSDIIEVDGHRIFPERRRLYIMLNKPRFCVTTLRDPQGRPTVARFVSNLPSRVFPVGRLDWDAEGLLLLTNDGFLAHRLSHPSFGVKKTYVVVMEGYLAQRDLDRLRKGVVLEEGRTAPAEVRLLRYLSGTSLVEIGLHQGWKRQIKRMGAKIGHPVLRIKRIGYGSLSLGRLPPGRWRWLTRAEVKALYCDVNRAGYQTRDG